MRELQGDFHLDFYAPHMKLEHINIRDNNSNKEFRCIFFDRKNFDGELLTSTFSRLSVLTGVSFNVVYVNQIRYIFCNYLRSRRHNDVFEYNIMTNEVNKLRGFDILSDTHNDNFISVFQYHDSVNTTTVVIRKLNNNIIDMFKFNAVDLMHIVLSKNNTFYYPKLNRKKYFFDFNGRFITLCDTARFDVGSDGRVCILRDGDKYIGMDTMKAKLITDYYYNLDDAIDDSKDYILNHKHE